MPVNRCLLYLLAAVVAVVTFAAYLPALQHQFVDWDDGTYVFNNPHLRSLNLEFITWAFTSFYAGNWHPLTWISHGIDWAIWGANPRGHHLVNNLLHAVNSGMVTIFMHRIITVADEKMPESQNVAGPQGGSLLAAGLAGIFFGLHPIHVESVAWVAERKDLLCALFYLLTLHAYVRAAVVARAPGNQPVAPMFSGSNLLCLFLFALALLSKPMAVTLPLILLLLDWYPLGRIDSLRQGLQAVTAKLPFFALSLGSVILTLLSQSAGGAIKAIPLGTRLAVAVTSLIGYLGKLLLPLHLIPFYPYPDATSVFTFPTFAAMVVAVSISAFCFVKACSNQLWLAIWLYYTVTLLPVLGIVQVGRQAMADRYTYLPSLAPLLLTGLAGAWAAGRWKHGRKIVAGLILLIAIMLGGLTVRQLGYWQDSITLWNYVISNTTRELDFAYNNRAIAWHRLGQLDKAAADFEMALQVTPNNIDYLNNRGIILSSLRRYDEALVNYEKAITLMPQDGRAYYNVACLHALRNDTSQACTFLRKGIEHGYTNWRDIKADHDLDAIRAADCYQEIVKGK